jgi:shikimate dehydrogenase
MARLGVFGWPVAHSRSPAMHAAAFAATGLDGWRYQRLPVPPALFSETARALGRAGFLGANVTIPHKEAALALADEAGPAAQAIGAANMLTFADNGAVRADNTDAPGLIEALGVSPRGLSALVLGAGGSARAAVWALLDGGASEVSVLNRTTSRAQALASELGARAVTAPVTADILVNCTSVGLGYSSSPTDILKLIGVNLDDLGGYLHVVDLVYSDGPTALVEQARALCASVVDGLDVLVAQGALSFEQWTGHQAPRDVMRHAAAAGN